jgi:hypothetical protein|tara:strand:+ start:100 stop:207 length:108 start_codon:yes stop_codon:yes gene_type:complete
MKSARHLVGGFKIYQRTEEEYTKNTVKLEKERGDL